MDYLHLTFCVFNAYLSYTATMLNIVAIYAIRKTSSLSKNLKTLLLSQAVSDLGVGLLVQPMVVAQAMNSKRNSETRLIPTKLLIFATNLFIFATLFSVTALCADRFLAIRVNLRYQELVTYKRVAAAVISIWVISALMSLIRLFLSRQIIYVSFVVIESACIVTATFLSARLYLTLRRHMNSTLNPLIYCWKMKHIQHTIVGTLRNIFSSLT